MRGSITRRCTTCSTNASESSSGWACPNYSDHPLKWTARADVNPPGAPRKRARRTFDTKRQAEKWIAKAQVEREAPEDRVDPTRMTFREFVEARWFIHLETAVLPRTGRPRKPSTVQSYKDLMNLYALPAIGDIPIQSLTGAELVRLYGELVTSGGRSGEGLSDRTVRYVHTVIHRALKDAERWNLVHRNVAALVAEDIPTGEKPEGTPVETKAWTPGELGVFLEAIAGDWHYPLYFTYATTGARRGELLALRWSDVDLASGTLSITKSRNSVDYQVVEGPPKTRKANRRLSLDPATVEVLREWRERQDSHGIKSIAGYVFTRQDGQPHHPERVSKVFSQMVAGLDDVTPISLHGLRHTYATIAITRGVPLAKVSARLGHSSISITYDLYGHLEPELDDEAAGVIAGAIGDA